MLRRLSALVAMVALATPAVAFEVVTVPDGGVLTGIVRFTGTPPGWSRSP